MRVGVVDIGTNTTRMLAAEVDPGGELRELDRRTTITRLGQGVERSGRLADEAMARVEAVVAVYRAALDELRPEREIAVLTSAVRDAANGEQFRERLRDRYGLDARTLSGDEEALYTFLGASHERAAEPQEVLLVLDIGGGSTEYVLGRGGEVAFHVSTPLGSVRHTERHLHTDPPTDAELRSCAADVSAVIETSLPAGVLAGTDHAVAVAGTATTLAAIDQDLLTYDPERVHGYVLSIEACRRILAFLAALPLAEREKVTGLLPERAPTIVAGAIILVVSLEVFGRDRVEVSEHDILHGAALTAAREA